MSVAFPDNLFLSQCLHGKRKTHKPFLWTLCKKHWSWESPFMLHHLVRIFSTPYTHIMSVHFPADMKHRLITKHNTIKKTFLSHCILHLNAEVSSVDVVCWFQKLQQVKTVGLHVQSLLQHPPHSHTGHLQFTTLTVHSFLRTAKKSLSHSFHAFVWHAAFLHFSLSEGTPLSETAYTSVWCYWELGDHCWIVARMPAEQKQLIHASQIAAQKMLSALESPLLLYYITLREKRGTGLRLGTKLEHLLFDSMWETYFCVRFESHNGRLKLLQSFWCTLYFKTCKHNFDKYKEYRTVTTVKGNDEYTSDMTQNYMLAQTQECQLNPWTVVLKKANLKPEYE